MCICHAKLVPHAQCVEEFFDCRSTGKSKFATQLRPLFTAIIQCSAHITADAVSISRSIVSHYSIIRGLKKPLPNLENNPLFPWPQTWWFRLSPHASQIHPHCSMFDNLGQAVWQNYTWCMQKFRSYEEKLINFHQISAVSCNLTSIW